MDLPIDGSGICGAALLFASEAGTKARGITMSQSRVGRESG